VWPPTSRCLLLACLLLLPAASAGGDAFAWVDDSGITHLTDDPASVPEPRRAGAGELDSFRSLWDDGIVGPPLETPKGSSSSEEDRLFRLLRGAAHDLERGEMARASATLRSVVRIDPTRPEAHWYLALLDRQRGRYDSAESHLRAFLDSAGSDFAPWRASAERRLAALSDERRLADAEQSAVQLRLDELKSPNFRIQVDSALWETLEEYPVTALRYLEEAREEVSEQLGVSPLEPLGVVFYSRGAYIRAHKHRFSFQTVGFFDGRIHVSSPAHPSGGLRALLYHEYTHAVFREQTGGDRPYWLNEGLAEAVERRSRKQRASTRSERASLRTRIEAGMWIPLRTLAPSFSGLSDSDARAAYLQAVIAAAWIEARTDRDTRSRLLQRLGQGYSADQALTEAVGLDTDGLDAALRAEIQSEFPPID
jgi:tetratricopeptide (TPR) repeat protein